MLRIQPLGDAPLSYSYYAAAAGWNQPAPYAQAPWQFEPSSSAPAASVRPWGHNPPLEHVSSALTIENALWQRNMLLQCGVGYEHVGMLVVYGQYSAKGASLQAVMPAVWASAEYAKLVDKKRELLDLPSS